MPLRRAHIVLLAIALAASGSAACTLLARFDDLPPLDAGADAGAEASVDAALPLDAGADVAPSDAAPDVDPCLGKSSGSYCGNDGLDYPGSPTDLVRCDGGVVAEVIACDGGCLALTNPFPDTCNGCNTKPSGSYCGRDFAVFPSGDADWLIQCQLGNATQKIACPHGCTSNGASSSCVP